MAGAERLAGLDLDRGASRPRARAIMTPVHDEPAGGDRRQGRLRQRHPVLSGTASNAGSPTLPANADSAATMTASEGTSS